jgi:hypothetical protein
MAEDATARVSGVAVALETSAAFGAAVGGGSCAPAQLHIMVTDKNAVREKSIIALISHEVASFAQLPALGERDRLRDLRPTARWSHRAPSRCREHGEQPPERAATRARTRRRRRQPERSQEQLPI